MSLVAYADGDGDGVGAGDGFSVCVEDASTPPAGTAWIAGDCDDSAAAVTQTITGYADADGDHVTVATATELCVATLPAGYLAQPNGDDCDDHDPTVSMLHTFYTDSDGDGYGDAAGATMLCKNEPPSGFAIDGSDPDDQDPLATPLDTDGDLVANANDCAPNDASTWTIATIYVDADGDQYSAGSQSACIGATAPPGFSLSTYGTDCDDQDPTKWSLYAAYVDADHDGVGVGVQMSICSGAQLPAGYANTAPDCDDADPTVGFALRAYTDADGDGYGTGSSTLLCASALPSGYAAQGGDCDDQNPNVHALLVGHADQDGDGYGAAATQQICAAALPAGYVTNGYDTDDTNAQINVRKVTASVYQPSNPSSYCNGGYCSGVILLVLTQDVPTEVTVSSYSRAMWCIYGRSNTVITSATAMGYELNTISPKYMCGLSNLQFACNSTYTYMGVTYSKKNVGSAACVGETSPGTYITNYDTYSASVLAR